MVLTVSFCSISKTVSAIIDGPENENDVCVGALSLHKTDGTEIKIIRDDIVSGNVKDILGKRTYFEKGQKDGTCCYRLKLRKGRYYDMTSDDEHKVRNRVINVEMIACVSRANIIVPVVASSFCIVLIVTISLLLWRRYKVRRQLSLPVPTQEDSP